MLSALVWPVKPVSSRSGSKVQSSLPFVHRSDLVGRAFFIFFPTPPLGDFRPRFLP